jgi:histidinol-phosphatase (PHP family)
MPWFSYHGGHSGEFCGHAKDSLEAIVRAAIERGFTHYGLSEHGPRYEASSLFPEERAAGVGQLHTLFEAYAEEARRLQSEYADRIELLVGFETEKLPSGTWASTMRELRDHHNFDYVVGSVHDLSGHWVDYSAEMTAKIAEEVGGKSEMQRLYFESLAELVETLEPEIVGHLDLIRKFDGMQARIETHVFSSIDRALEAARAAGARLDVNCGAYRRGLSPVYPLPEILRRAHAMEIRVTLGDDGHGVATVGAGLDASLRAIAEAGYREIDYLTRSDGETIWASAPIDEVKPALL